MKISLRLNWKPIYWLLFVCWLANGQDCINDLNTVLQDGVCICKTSYTLNSQSKCQLDCNQVDNTQAQLDSTTCYCIDNFLWDSTTSSCLIVCTEFSYTTGKRNGNSACFCIDRFFWIGDSCLIDCTSIQNSNGLFISQTECLCNRGFRWNGSTCISNCTNTQYLNGTSCYINCSKIGNSDGPLNRTACKCLSGFSWNGLNCTFSCSEIPNSNGSDSSNKGCNCVVGYYWNASQVKCVETLNCSSIPNANGISDSGGCSCLSNFFWNQSTQSCLVNCSKFPNAISSISLDKCICIQSYSWSGDVCLLNCSAIPNALNLTQNKGRCTCKIGYFWHSFNNSCVQVNCSNIQFAVSTVSIKICSCANNFKWNFTTLRCEINCKSIPSTNGPVENSDGLSCRCSQKFFWNAQFQLCQINCSQVDDSKGQVLLTKCRCLPNFDWDNTGKCVLNCSKDPKSKTSSTPLPPGLCKCQNFYVWNTTLKQCRINCAIIFGTVGEAPNNEQCKCDRYAIWNHAYFKCIPNCKNIPGSDGILDQKSRMKCGCKDELSWQSKPMACK